MPSSTPTGASVGWKAAATTGAEAAAVVAYGRLLKQDVLDALPMGWYNLHFSLLPQWRGAAPVQRALIAGDPVLGASVFRLVAELDAGDVFATREIALPDSSTADVALATLADDGAALTAEQQEYVVGMLLYWLRHEMGVSPVPRA